MGKWSHPENPISPAPRVDGTRLVKDLIRYLQRLEDGARKNLDQLDAAKWILYRIEKRLGEKEGARPRRRLRRVARMPKGPAPTVLDLTIKGTGNGAAVVTFDSGVQVPLPPTLKELILILAADHGVSPDELVPWKSFTQVSQELEERLDRKFDRHALSQLLWRLRESLAAVEESSRDLIEGDPVLGVRLRLKRSPPAALCAG